MPEKSTYEELEQRVIELEQENLMHRQLKDQLEKSEKEYRLFAENSLDVIWALTLDGEYTYISPSSVALVGFTPEELKKIPLENSVTPESYSVITKTIAEALESPPGERSPVIIEVQQYTRDGSVLDVEVSASLVLDDSGKPTGIQGSTRDISLRKKAQDSLKKSEEEYRLLLSSMNDVVVRVSPEGNILYVSPSIIEFGRYDPEGEIGSDVSNYFADEEDLVRGLHLLEAIFESKKGGRFEFLFKPKTGEPFYVENSYIPIIGDNNEVVEIQLVMRDITERKKVENALKESEKKLSDLLNNTRLLMWAFDGKYFSYLNDEWYHYSGQDLALPRTVERWTEVVHPDDIDAAWRIWKENMEAKVEHDNYFRLRRKDGVYRDFYSHAVPIFNGDGSFKHLQGFSVDITEQKLAEEEVKKKEAQLQRSQKMESVGILAGGIAHEFNNLLFVVSGIAELLLIDAVSGTKSNLKEIVNATQRGSKLVRQLLAFSRKAETDFLRVILNTEINKMETMLNQLLPRMIKIDLDLDPDLNPVKAGPGQLEQIIMNLSTNAQDAMPEGGLLTIKTENGEFSFEEHRDWTAGLPYGKCVILTVSDTGLGMDKKTKEHIFDPFFTTKEIGKGTGLGLSVIYGIIKGHQGHIVCESEPGAGTTFKVFFPVAVDENKISIARKKKVKQLPKGTETLLIVDDEEGVVHVLETMVRRLGYTSFSTNCGEAALELYTEKHNEIDLILLDLGMPGMGGKKCLEKLIEFDKNVKVVIASGYSEEGQICDEIDAGARGYVVKPFKIDVISKKIRDVLDGRQGVS